MFKLAREIFQQDDRARALRTAARFTLYGFAVGSSLNLYDFMILSRIPNTYRAETKPRAKQVYVRANDFLAVAEKAGVDATPVCGHCGETSEKNN